MSVFELLTNFWRVDEQQNFSGNETRLYFYLIHLANRSFWAEWLECPNQRLTGNTNL